MRYVLPKAFYVVNVRVMALKCNYLITFLEFKQAEYALLIESLYGFRVWLTWFPFSQIWFIFFFLCFFEFMH